jgi:UDP-N-acetylmuramate dehydrogenase
MLLSDCTTLELGGPARRFVAATCDADLVAAVSDCDARGEPVFVLGGGSNVVFADEGFDGAVVRVATRGVVFDGDVVDVAAGEPWDDLVAWSVRAGRAGLEGLSGIPGLVGATPIQNVGAYGQEVKDTLVSVRAWDREEKRIVVLARDACRFSYRHSMLKETSRFVVLRVAFDLPRSAASAPIRYAELARALGVREGEAAPLARVRETVIALRRGKGMVLDPADPDTRSAGSFFVNPTMDEAAYEALAARAGEKVPRFAADAGLVKVPAAWLIERAGFTKGASHGGAAISSKHALAITNRANATTADVLALARAIRAAVESRFGLPLTPEPVLVGCSLEEERTKR